jgi:hypothetical protein
MQLHPLKLGKSQKVQTPEAVAPPADQDSISSLRKAAIPPAAYEEVLKQQVQSLFSLVSCSYVDLIWSNRQAVPTKYMIVQLHGNKVSGDLLHKQLFQCSFVAGQGPVCK